MRTIKRKNWLAAPPKGAGYVVDDVDREDEYRR